MKNFFDKQKCIPFILTGFIIAADQLLKAFIVRNWPREGTFIKDLFGNELIEFYHVRNKAIAFSLGQNLPEGIKPVLFIILPVIVLGFLLWYYFKTTDFTKLQRWAVAGIIGGGTGNIVDRIFRPDGVVDIVSIKLYGLLGMERWPTFNIADSSVVVCSLIFFISILFFSKSDENKTGAKIKDAKI